MDETETKSANLFVSHVNDLEIHRQRWRFSSGICLAKKNLKKIETGETRNNTDGLQRGISFSFSVGTRCGALVQIIMLG